MDKDTKLVLDAWRRLLVENHRLAGECEKLRDRIAVLERKDVDECFDMGGDIFAWRRVGRRHRRSFDGDD